MFLKHVTPKKVSRNPSCYKYPSYKNTMSQAQFYNLTSLYPSGYDGFIGEDEEEYHDIVREYIRDHKYKFNDGDILFLGDTYEGFYYVTDSCTDIVHGESVYDCLLQERHKLYYDDVLDELAEFIEQVLGKVYCYKHSANEAQPAVKVCFAEELLESSFINDLREKGKLEY